MVSEINVTRRAARAIEEAAMIVENLKQMTRPRTTNLGVVASTSGVKNKQRIHTA